MWELIICTNNHENCSFEGYFESEQDALDHVKKIVIEELCILKDFDPASANTLSLDDLEEKYYWQSTGLIEYRIYKTLNKI